MFLAGRCLVMLLRFGQDGQQDDLDEAVSTARRAVALTSVGHQFRALYLGRLGFALLARLGLQPSSEDESEAESAGREAAAITTRPALRAAAAAMWGQMAAGRGGLGRCHRGLPDGGRTARASGTPRAEPG